MYFWNAEADVPISSSCESWLLGDGRKVQLNLCEELSEKQLTNYELSVFSISELLELKR